MTRKQSKNYTINIIRRGVIIVGLVSLSACSHSNVSGEWECPRPSGQGCINIAVADNMAMRKLHEGEVAEASKPQHNYNVTSSNPVSNSIISEVAESLSFSGKFRKIWFAPYTDSAGNWHDTSVVYYQE